MQSREFNQNTGRAKNAADRGPVLVTHHNKPAYVLVDYQFFLDLASNTFSAGEMLRILLAGKDAIDREEFELSLASAQASRRPKIAPTMRPASHIADMPAAAP